MSFISCHFWRWIMGVSLFSFVVLNVRADDPSHTVTLLNNCGFGSALLVQPPGQVLARGDTNFTNATLQATAFLYQDFCSLSGGNCTTVEIDFTNQNISSAYIAKGASSTPLSFAFYNGCDEGMLCLANDCVQSGQSDQDLQLILCSSFNASIRVIFCPPPQNGSTVISALPALSSGTTSIIFPLPSPTNPLSVSLPVKPKQPLIGYIVGGVAGGLALLVILLAIYCWRRARARQSEDPPSAYVVNPTWVRTYRTANPPTMVVGETPTRRSISPPSRSVWED